MTNRTLNETLAAELEEAIELLRTGGPLPLDVAAALIEQGYDVEAIEQAFAK